MQRVAALAVALPLFVIASAAPAPSAEQAATVQVRMTQARCALSKTHVPAGSVRFDVLNAGSGRRYFAIGTRRTRDLVNGKRQLLVVRLTKAGRYAYRCAAPGPKPTPKRGVLRVDAPVPPLPPATYVATEVGKFEVPTDIDAPPGDVTRLVVAEQGGRVHLILDGVRREQPFLDLSEEVLARGESGLLSIAFAPDYAESGLAYVALNDPSGNLRLVEFARAADDPNRLDPASEREVLAIEMLSGAHNGGMLQFGPDGYLYFAVCDGGATTEIKPGRYAQALDSLLGKILRLDPRPKAEAAYSVPEDNPFVAREGARPEIWAYGFRNPWRFWIDAAARRMYVADVGAERREEIDLIPLAAGGGNYGWPCLEGTTPYDETETCENTVAPFHEYAHGEVACSISGGVVVQDERLLQLAGAYLFGDLCGSEVKALRIVNGLALVTAPGIRVANAISFGADALGRAYVGSVEGGVYRIDPGG
jgi:glucose/arabinose dehydrogenase